MNKLPEEVKEILEILNKKHKAYLVGGCLRDMLMGKIPWKAFYFLYICPQV